MKFRLKGLGLNEAWGWCAFVETAARARAGVQEAEAGHNP
jgi:hypothetical protein